MKVAIIQIHGCGILEFFKKIIISGHIIFCDLPPAPQRFTHSATGASNNNNL